MKAKILITAGVMMSLCGFTAAATVSNFSAETTNPSNTFATGTLVLSNTKTGGGGACLSTGGGNTNTNVNGACDTLFSLTVKKPGDSGSAQLTVQNVGSLSASALKLYSAACTDADASGESYHGTGSACGGVQLYIQQWTSNTFATPSACIYGGGTT